MAGGWWLVFYGPLVYCFLKCIKINELNCCCSFGEVICLPESPPPPPPPLLPKEAEKQKTKCLGEIFHILWATLFFFFILLAALSVTLVWIIFLPRVFSTIYI